MTDRGARLAGARLLDWRFALPAPRLDRVALVEPADAALRAALEGQGIAVEVGSGSGGADAVVLGHDVARAADAMRALRPGGWLLADLPPGRRARGASARLRRGLGDAGAEGIRRLWSHPSRDAALRIVPLDDPDAVRTALSMHGSSARKRLQAGVARQVARLGGTELLGGQVSLLARRAGGEPVSGWPALDALAPILAEEGLARPSWILLTPRFPASAHVVLLLLSGGAPALVAKVARLLDDDGPEREAAVLRAFAEAGGDASSAPAVVHAGRLDGHALLLERAVSGRPVDRRRVRRDPGRWIGAVARWTSRMPLTGRIGDDAYASLVQRPIGAAADRMGDPATTALATATLDLLAPLRDRALPLVFEHGDLGHPNLLAGPDDRIGVIDWELARPDGLPLNDLMFFLGYVALALAGDDADPFAAFTHVLGEPAWDAREAIRREAQRLDLPAETLPLLVVACWARAAASLAERLGAGGSTPEPRSIGRHRYYSLWSRAVEQQGRLAALLS